MIEVLLRTINERKHPNYCGSTHAAACSTKRITPLFMVQNGAPNIGFIWLEVYGVKPYS